MTVIAAVALPPFEVMEGAYEISCPDPECEKQGVLQMADRHQHLERGQALRSFALAWPAATLALCVPLALGFWVATWMRSAVNAVATAVALYLVMYVIAEIHFFEDLRPWLFTSYMAYWRGLFREAIDWGDLLRDATRLLAFAALFCALAFRQFRLREEP